MNSKLLKKTLVIVALSQLALFCGDDFFDSASVRSPILTNGTSSIVQPSLIAMDTNPDSDVAPAAALPRALKPLQIRRSVSEGGLPSTDKPKILTLDLSSGAREAAIEMCISYIDSTFGYKKHIISAVSRGSFLYACTTSSKTYFRCVSHPFRCNKCSSFWGNNR